MPAAGQAWAFVNANVYVVAAPAALDAGDVLRLERDATSETVFAAWLAALVVKALPVSLVTEYLVAR